MVLRQYGSTSTEVQHDPRKFEKVFVICKLTLQQADTPSKAKKKTKEKKHGATSASARACRRPD
jgi:hypothetical protein